MWSRISGLALVGLVGAAVYGGIAPAQAALVCGGGICTDTVTIGPQRTELSGATMLFPLFDSNIGILSGALVTVTAETRIMPGSSVTNNAATPQTFRVRQEVEFTLIDTTAPGGALDVALQSLLLIPSTGLVMFVNVPGTPSAPLNTVPFGPRTDSATDDLTAAAGSLAPFQAPGGGTHTFSADTLTITTLVGGGGNIAANFITEGFVSFDILYAYVERDTDTPEPMSLALMGVGLAGLGAASAVRRRRMARMS